MSGTGQAVIICGGLGTRLRPLTYDIPKSMVPVNGRPFLEYIIEFFRGQGVSRFLLCTGNLHEHMEAHFGDGKMFGVEIIHSSEPEPLGTGGALLNAGNLTEERFFLAYGDSLLRIDLADLERIFDANDALGAISVYRNCDGIAPNNVRIAPDGRILEYVKRDPPAGMNGLEAGLSLFSRDILDLAPGRKFSLEEAILPQLINRRRLFGLLTPSRFLDMGTPEGLERAGRELNDDN